MSSKQRIICASVSRPPAEHAALTASMRAPAASTSAFSTVRSGTSISKQFVRNTGRVWISLRACR